MRAPARSGVGRRARAARARRRCRSRMMRSCGVRITRRVGLADVEARDFQAVWNRTKPAARRRRTRPQEWRRPGAARRARSATAAAMASASYAAIERQRRRARAWRARPGSAAIVRTVRLDDQQQQRLERARQRETPASRCRRCSTMPTSGTTIALATIAYGASVEKIAAVSGHVPICVAHVRPSASRIRS